MSRLGRRAVLLAGAAFGVARAQAQTTPAAPDPAPIQAASADAAIAQASINVAPVDVGARIENQMQDFIDQSGFAPRQARGELWVVQGTAPVSVQANDPDWAKFRMVAYTQALLNAQAQFAKEQGLRIGARAVSEPNKAPSDNVPAFVPAPALDTSDANNGSPASNAKRSAKAGANAKTDARTEAVQEPQRTDLINSKIEANTKRSALADVIGLIPVQTFEGHDGSGHFEIGVVAVISPKMRDFAVQVLKARGEFVPDPSRAQDLSKLTADKSDLLRQFGVRLLYDERGLPAIVSFAQWASHYRGPDPVLAAMYRDAARDQAEALADGQIADFLNASTIYLDNSAAGQDVAQTASVRPGSASAPITADIIDELQKKISRDANVRITGIRTLTTWTGIHPVSGQPIIVMVRMWSAASEQAVRAFQAPRPAAQPAATAAPPTGPAGVTQGNSLMKASDF